MKKIALLGHKGFLGSRISKHLENNSNCIVQNIDRATFNSRKFDEKVDYVINSAMPSARFWAESNPNLDFIETVEKTNNIIREFSESKIIQISSISAKTQLHKVYGRNKKAAESLLDLNENLIYRLGPLYGDGLSKGVIVDLINNNDVYVAGESQYAFTNIDWVAKKIIENLDLNGLVELGSSGHVKLSDLKSFLSSESKFVGEIDNQVFDDYFENTPPATDVYHYASKLKNNI